MSTKRRPVIAIVIAQINIIKWSNFRGKLFFSLIIWYTSLVIIININAIQKRIHPLIWIIRNKFGDAINIDRIKDNTIKKVPIISNINPVSDNFDILSQTMTFSYKNTFILYINKYFKKTES